MPAASFPQLQRMMAELPTASAAPCYEGIRYNAMIDQGGLSFMRIETLYEFLLLTSNLNFTETAKSFFISQSVLSGHILSLEKELDTRLFVRDRHSVRLTEAGRLFQQDAQRIVEDYEHALERLSQYAAGVSAVIRIGFLEGSYGSFLPLVCRAYRREHPDVDFHFRTMELANMQKALNENEIDVGLAIYSSGIQGTKYGYRCLFEDRYQLAVPIGHRLANRNVVRFADLKGETVIVPPFNRSKNTLEQMHVKLRNAGALVRPSGDFVDVGAMMATLVASGSVAISLDHLRVFGNGNVTFIPLEGEDLDICAGPIWKKSKENDALVSFLDFLERSCKGFAKKDYLARNGADELPPMRLPQTAPRVRAAPASPSPAAPSQTKRR